MNLIDWLGNYYYFYKIKYLFINFSLFIDFDLVDIEEVFCDLIF